MNTSATESFRLRFAPSPTGLLHLGNARTALFNWLLARGRGGIFVLRIEDTDRERSSAESEAGILDDLRWLGLDWDEGPDCGGPAAPYRQSEADAIYQEALQRLRSRGAVYPCFCSPEQLEADRAAQGGHGGYGGRCRTLDPAEATGRIEAGEPHVWRLRFPASGSEIECADLVRGVVRFPVDTLGGDMVLVRADGSPTYQFAVVVDDHRMGITQVLRGEDHLTNTPKQLILYEAMGWEPPRFGHMAMILGPDRSKLSKRHGSTHVRQLREAGFLPEAALNGLALLGWSPGDDREFMTREELVADFSPERLVRSAGIFDPDKLRWLNGLHIRALAPEVFADRALAWLREQRPEALAGLPSERLPRGLTLLQAKVETLAELEAWLALWRIDPPPLDDDARALLAQPETGTVLGLVEAALPDLPAADEAVEAWLDARIAEGKVAGLKGRSLFQSLRFVLTGSAHGPDLKPLLAALGTDLLRRRVAQARARLADHAREEG